MKNWEIQKQENGRYQIVDATGFRRSIAGFLLEDDAITIVDAVNSHEQMTEALELAREIISSRADLTAQERRALSAVDAVSRTNRGKINHGIARFMNTTGNAA